MGPTQDTEDNIVFDELRRPEEDNLRKGPTRRAKLHSSMKMLRTKPMMKMGKSKMTIQKTCT